LDAALDGERGERAFPRGGDIDKLPLHVALDGAGRGRAATGQQAEEGQSDEVWAGGQV
jgi:hypothetical protein